MTSYMGFNLTIDRHQLSAGIKSLRTDRLLSASSPGMPNSSVAE